jgi:hypothetical protein
MVTYPRNGVNSLFSFYPRAQGQADIGELGTPQAGQIKPGANPSRLDLRPLFQAAVVVLGAGLLTGMLYLFDPGQYAFYPRCLFHATTGLNCPGCGALRAAHQLLHGNLGSAWALNPLLVLLSPWLAWMSFASLARALTGRAFRRPFTHPRWMWVLLAILIAFGVCRNLPLAAATRLAL